jgi:2-dehydro-3-deoxygluconokinase
MADSFDIISIGECMIELSTNESLIYAEILHKYYGGDTLNAAVAAARLGSKVGYITRVGRDSFQTYLLDSWQAENIDTSNIKIVEGYNGLYILSIQEESRKEFVFYRKKSASTTLSTDDISEEYIQSANIVYSTGITQSLSASAKGAVKKAFCIAKDKGCLVAYDPNYRERLWDTDEANEAMEEIIDCVDIIMLNNIHDAEWLIDQTSPDKIIKYFWDKGVSTVAVKMGKKGCVIGYNGEISTIPSKEVEPVDSTGAGDAFNGGFLHGISCGYTPFESARLATIVASEQIKGLGAVKSLPYRDQVYTEFGR